MMAENRCHDRNLMTQTEDNRTATPIRFPWPPVLLAGIVAAAMALGTWVPLDWPGEDVYLAHIVGLNIGAAGLVLLLWSALTLHRHSTTIHPGKLPDVLVTDGPFRFRRNPIYIGHVLVLLGIAELTHNIWFVILAAAYIPLVTWLAVLPEERDLEARFGEAYRTYKANTRRWI